VAHTHRHTPRTARAHLPPQTVAETALSLALALALALTLTLTLNPNPNATYYPSANTARAVFRRQCSEPC